MIMVCWFVRVGLGSEQKGGEDFRENGKTEDDRDREGRAEDVVEVLLHE